VNNSVEPRADVHLTGYVWYVIVLLTIVNLVNYMDRMALAVLAPLVKKDLALTDTQLGLLVGFAFALFYAICGIPIARWADRGSRRNIIALAVATWSVMTALCGAAHNFWQLFLARVGVGAGEAGSFAPGSSLVCDYVPLERRPGVFGVTSFGIYAGLMVGMVSAGWLGEIFGWRWAFVVLAAPGLLLALVVRLTLREPQRGRLDAKHAAGANAPLGRTVRQLWRSRTYRRLVVSLIAGGFVQYGFNQWWPSFFARTFDLKPSALGAYLGLAIGVGSGVGVLLGGLLADRTAARDVRLPLMIVAGAALLAMPAAFGTLFSSSIEGAMWLVAASALFWGSATGPTLASLYSVSAPHVRATAGAFYIFLTSVLGLGLGPFCVGALSDLLAPSHGAESLRYALLLPIALLPVMAVALYLAARSLPDDLRTVGANAVNASG
jgi:predicted MFS family arabinose efflux permease